MILRVVKMGEKASDEAERIIKNRDERYFKYRVQRLREFGEVVGTVRLGEVSTVTYDTKKAPPVHYLQSYIDEAQESFLGGNFRSCIFCCAAAVEQVIKYELIKSSGDPKAEIRKIESGRLGLGKLVEILENRPSDNERILKLKKFLDSLDWINKARISIAVHPPYASVYDEDDTDEIKTWKNERMVYYINRILDLLSAQNHERVLDLNVGLPEGVSTTFRELLKNSKSKQMPEVWYLFTSREVQQPLALENYRRMKEIIEGVYPC